MKKVYCIKGDKYKNIKKSKLSYFFNKLLVLSIICDKCIRKNEKSI